MNHRALNSTTDNDSEKLAPIIEAIIEGKYSWACVLLLRTMGYNPLHYIPYRTYNRLVKDNYLANTKQPDKLNGKNQQVHDLHQERSRNIRDLPYSKSIGERNQTIRGGSPTHWLTSHPYRHPLISDEFWEKTCTEAPQFLRSVSKLGKY